MNPLDSAQDKSIETRSNELANQQATRERAIERMNRQTDPHAILDMLVHSEAYQKACTPQARKAEERRLIQLIQQAENKR